MPQFPDLLSEGNNNSYRVLRKFFFKFILEKECVSGGGRAEEERENPKANSLLSMEPYVGLDPTTLIL